MSPVSERLVRLLNMVPYFQANPRITYAEAASDLGVSVKQLRDDLNQLWMCGLPGYGPGDLIDFEFSGDTIEVTFSAGIRAVVDRARRGLDLGDRAARGFGVDHSGHVDECPQCNQHPGGFR